MSSKPRRAPAASSQASLTAAPSSLNPRDLEAILKPEMDQDRFHVNGKSYRLRVLPWRWEMEFRKHALPIVRAELKPVESLLFAVTTGLHMVKEDLELTEKVIASETEADNLLLPAMVSILMSQDPVVMNAAKDGIPLTAEEEDMLMNGYRVRLENVEMPDGGSPRAYFRKVVRAQMAKQRLIETLGESLLVRSAEFANLAGIPTPTFVSLLQGTIRHALNSSGSDTKIASIVDKLSGSFTDNLSAITSPSPMTAPTAVTEEAADVSQSPVL